MAPIEIGSYRPIRARRPLGPLQNLVARAFFRLYYRCWQRGLKGPSPDTLNLHWFGHQLIKCPFDLWTYQELLVEYRPDVVIETGTFRGGTTLYLASLLDLLGHGRVISIDSEDHPGRPAHPRIEYVKGSSVAPAVLARLRRAIGPEERAIVILDSEHSARFVAAEIRAYRDFVKPGGYLVVEDSCVNGHPVQRRFGPGPMEAIQAVLAEDDRFRPDLDMERFLVTQNPSGFLKRIR